jgi:hypothetical protein
VDARARGWARNGRPLPAQKYKIRLTIRHKMVNA